MLTVLKFGGSSLADADRIRTAARCCAEKLQKGQRALMVVSAMGDTTDELARLAREINPAPPKRESDALMSTGEQQSAALMAITLDSMGVPAMSFTGWQSGIFTDSVHTDASPEVTFPSRLEDALDKGVVPVVAGYQGIDVLGNITTLGRGGSDTTAVLLAAALKADACEIYTDVDGIYTADPRLVKDAKKLDAIDYRDMLALSLAGSQVLHHKSVSLAMHNNVEILLLSPYGLGGSRVTSLDEASRQRFAGVTRSASDCTVTLAGKACTAELLPMLTLDLSDAGVRVTGGGTRDNCVYIRTMPEQLEMALQTVHDMYF
ncbi:MAG: aspartate kinase [Eubacteriales bacterium]|nr:aspartate kinase [Eubacteriales bacterium]